MPDWHETVIQTEINGLINELEGTIKWQICFPMNG
jgi:hypothetical protein